MAAKSKQPAKYSADAIDAAIYAEKETGVPAVVTLAQYDLESSCGKHEPYGSNNPFGIKAVGNQSCVESMTWEVEHGKSVRVEQLFAKYPSLKEAFLAHGQLLNKPIYAAAMTAWREGKVASGVTAMAEHYATDPDYATKLLSIISTDNLAILVRTGGTPDKTNPGVSTRTKAPAKVRPSPAPASSVASQTTTIEGAPMESLLSTLFGNFASSLSGIAAVGEYAPEAFEGVAKAVPDLKSAGSAIDTLVDDVKGGKFGSLVPDASPAISAFGKILSDFGITGHAVAGKTAALATTPSVATLKATATK